jgi:hypothetical protein
MNQCSWLQMVSQFGIGWTLKKTYFAMYLLSGTAHAPSVWGWRLFETQRHRDSTKKGIFTRAPVAMRPQAYLFQSLICFFPQHNLEENLLGYFVVLISIEIWQIHKGSNFLPKIRESNREKKKKTFMTFVACFTLDKYYGPTNRTWLWLCFGLHLEEEIPLRQKNLPNHNLMEASVPVV